MTILRVLVGAVVVACCAGFIPVGGCAKGCGAAGRVGASHADDIARLGVRSASHYGDDIARGVGRVGGGAGHYAEELAHAGRYGRGATIGGIAHSGEDLAHMSRAGFETTISTLPEAEGAVASLARKPTASGAHLEGLDDAGRSFGKDYGKSIDDLAVTEKQHEDLMEAFETAQDIAETAIDALGSDDDESDPDRVVEAAKAREKLTLVALELEASVSGILSPEQLRKFRAQFGSSEVIAYRLGKEKPIARKGRDKVAP